MTCGFRSLLFLLLVGLGPLSLATCTSTEGATCSAGTKVCGNGCIPESGVCCSESSPSSSSYCTNNAGACEPNDRGCQASFPAGTSAQFCCGSAGSIGSNDCPDGQHHCGLLCQPVGNPCAVTSAPDAGSGPISYDGAWAVQVTIETCYSFTGTGTVTVTDGSFSGVLFTYTADAHSGATQLCTAAPCSGDCVEEVSVTEGRMAGGHLEGNLVLTGTCCNGGNAFSGTVPSSGAATAGSSWGSLTFSRK